MTPLEVLNLLIALPREAGSGAAVDARALLTRHLESRGFTVHQQPFGFQPASLLALPVVGAGLGWLTLLEIPLLALGNLPRVLAPLVWLGGAAALVVLAWGIGTGVDVPGAERRQDANLIATRGAGPVRRWIVAHLDTKAQGHSMAGRLIAVWMLVTAALLLTALTIVRARSNTPLSGFVVAGAAVISLVAGGLAGQGRLRGTSPGARDNGTGLLAALQVAEATRDDGIGLIFTGAEEFGLVGARVFVRSESVASTEIINLDTLTDRGILCLVVHDEAGKALAASLAPLLGGIAPRLRIRRLPLGILVDSLPFARAGACSVTVSRLDWDDLRRLHTARDSGDGLGLATATAVGCAVARLR